MEVEHAPAACCLLPAAYLESDLVPIDAAKGDSGAGIFCCPLEDCAANRYWVISVMSKFNPVSGRYAGPRADVFRQFVLDALP